MKPLSIALSLAAVAFTALAAVSADAPSETLPLRYLQVADAYDTVKEQLGPEAASAVLALDLRANTLRLATDHPEAARVRGIIVKLDTRPPTVRVAAIIKRIIPATPGAEAREEILARPTVIGPFGKPIILSTGDAEHGSIEVELQLTAVPEASK